MVMFWFIVLLYRCCVLRTEERLRPWPPSLWVSPFVMSMSISHLILHKFSHFSIFCLFCVCVCAAGSSEMEAKVDSVLGAQSKQFYLHYKFPPSCTGDVS